MPAKPAPAKPAPASPAVPAAPAGPAPAGVSGETLAIPLASIVSRLPQVLQANLVKPPESDDQVQVPLKIIQEQLPRGSVKISFGELRRASPPGIFSNSNGQDQTAVELPLQEIIPQMKAAQLGRRRDQKKGNLPSDVEVPHIFGGRGQPLARRAEEKASEPTPARAAPPSPKLPEPTPAPKAQAAPPPETPSTKPIAQPSQPIPSGIALPKPAVPAPAPTPARVPPAIGAEKVPVKLPPPPAKMPATPAIVPSAPVQPSIFTAKVEPFFARWPEPVQQELKRLNLADAALEFPFADIDQALKRGKVVFTWKQVRAALRPSPPIGMASALDDTQLDLPLGLVAPLFLAQRTPVAPQKKITITDVPDVFAMPRPAPAPAAPAHVPPAAPSPPAPAAVVSPPPQPAPAATPATPVAQAIPPAAPPPKPAQPEAAEKIPFAPAPAQQPSTPATAVAQQPSAPIPAPPAPAQPVAGEAEGVVGKLEAFVVKWPEPVQQELKSLKLGDATIEVPFAEMEPQMRRGKVAFPWKQLRSAIRPVLPARAATAHDDASLELSLGALVPGFLAKLKPRPPQRQVKIADNIPSLFTQIPTAPSAEAGPAEAAGAPPAAGAEAGPLAGADFGQIFGQPDKRNWTPMEIVQKTATLPGVAGAAIALQEGLQVASQLPPDLSGETFAAFLPQIFGRMTQYTKEMNLGEPTQLSLVANNAALQIFKSGKIYFTVLGRAGQLLPMSQLTAIANQLGRQSR